MIDPTLPEDLGALLRSLEDRIAELERGGAAPPQTSVFNSLVMSASTASGAWAPLFGSTIANVVADTLVMQSAYIVPSGVTYRVRLHEAITGNTTEEVELIGPVFLNSIRWEWLHGVNLAFPNRAEFTIQVRRVSGSGSITGYIPVEQQVLPSEYVPDADSLGNPAII